MVGLALVLSRSLSAFESAEHMAIGDSVHLQSVGKVLHLDSGLEASYGEIVALGGDFYAIFDAPISEGATVEDQKQRFINAFESLNNASPELPSRLIATFHNTLESIEKSGKKGSEVYAEIGGALQKEYNVLTGGGSVLTPLFPLGTAVLELLSPANWDHFLPGALTAYQAGHLAAIDEAIKAGQIKVKKKRIKALMRAYAMNAFACHYLSDSFSSGHMRTPRKELGLCVDLAFVGALLMDYMHGEDCRVGLNVKNLRGDEWTAYGDSYYFDPENAFSKDLLQQVMQLSADEVYFAFQNGYNPENEELLRLLPEVAGENTAPLFLWDKQLAILKRRENINCLDCYEWKTDWWGWTTLIDLGDYYHPLTPRQKSLHEALKY